MITEALNSGAGFTKENLSKNFPSESRPPDVSFGLPSKNIKARTYPEKDLSTTQVQSNKKSFLKK